MSFAAGTGFSRPVKNRSAPGLNPSANSWHPRRCSSQHTNWNHRHVPIWGVNGLLDSQVSQDQQHRRCAVSKGDASKASAGPDLQPGLLVVFKKDSHPELGLVLQPDGKRNWWLENQAGRRTSVPLKSVILVLPGNGYTSDALQQCSAAAAAADQSLLEIAWAVAAEEQTCDSFSLEQLCQLLFDAQGAQEVYTTFSMLLADKVYFKLSLKTRQGGVWFYQPKDAQAVQQAAAAAAAEAAEEAARQEFLRDWSAAVAAAAAQRPRSIAEQQEQWLAGPHQSRVQALLDYVMPPSSRAPKASQDLARQTLGLLKRRVEPEAAVEVLQAAGLLRAHEPVPLLRLGLDAQGTFAAKLQQAAEALLEAPPVDPDASRRLDLRHLTVFAIDDASTQDVDDGVSVDRAADGQLLLWVHVADPTRWLKPGDIFDVQARTRIRSLYFPFGSAPMFPRCLSEGPFSLVSSSSSSSSSSAATTTQVQGACNALSMCVTLNDDGSLGPLMELSPSTICVSHQLTYDAADADLSLGPELCQHKDLQVIYEAARLRRMWRVSQGCIDIDLPEAKLSVPLQQLDAAAPEVTCTKLSQWESAARMLVAEMMILAGEAVGRRGAEASLPLPYRGQEQPRLPSEDVINALPDGYCRGFALRKCMTRSIVSPTPVGHASLALDAYVQVTSPIRRYTDLIAHFNIKAHLRGEAPPFSASEITQIMASAAEVSRELGKAEGDVERYWAAEYMRQHWQRQQQHWRRHKQQQHHEPEGLPGMVLGWVRPELNLVAVTLEELGLETVIKVDFPVEPGDRLLLRVVEVDVPNGHFRLSVLDRLEPDSSASSLIELEADGDSAENTVVPDTVFDESDVGLSGVGEVATYTVPAAEADQIVTQDDLQQLQLQLQQRHGPAVI